MSVSSDSKVKYTHLDEESNNLSGDYNIYLRFTGNGNERKKNREYSID